LVEGLPAPAAFFPDAGQALLRDGWDEGATYVTFDATTWGGSHCHLSRNAIQVHAHGQSLLVDPGFLTYEPSDPAMAAGKSTRAHSTVNLNGWNQSTADPVRTRHYSARGYDLVCSEYEGGYWPGRFNWSFDQGLGRGIWARHSRVMLWVHRRCIIVIDCLEREPVARPEAEADAPSVECNWQLCEGPVQIDPGCNRAVTGHSDANLLMLFPAAPAGAKLRSHEGETSPLRGWLPTDHGLVPAPQLSMFCPRLLDRQAQFVTVLVPFVGSQAPSIAAEMHPLSANAVRGLSLRWPDGTSEQLYWTDRLSSPLGRQAQFDTDAMMLHLLQDSGGKLRQGMALHGTYAFPFDPGIRRTAQTFALPAQ
jgi:hypothetical protein